MSTERESKVMLGYVFSTLDLINFMKKLDPSEWNDDFFCEYDGYDAMISETFADFYELKSYSSDDVHHIGFEIKDGMDYTEVLTFVNEKALKLQEILNCDVRPKVYSCIFSY